MRRVSTFEQARRTTLGLLAIALVLVACDDDDLAEPNIATMRLTVGQQVVDVTREGECTGCPLVLSDGASITARWLTASGEPDPVALPTAYRLGVVVPQNTAGLLFALNPTNNFNGTFSASGSTSIPFNVTFFLRSILQGTDNFPATSVQVVVE